MALSKGVYMSSSIVYLSQVLLINISNYNADIRGNLLYARDITFWLDHVHLEKFTSPNVGVFDLIRSILFSQYFSAKNGTTIARVVGSYVFSYVNMQDTSIEALNSGGQMASSYQSMFNLTRITYSKLAGVYEPALKAYVTNLFSFTSESEAVITGLDIRTIVTGLLCSTSLIPV